MATGTIHSTLPNGTNTMLKKVEFTASEYTANKTSSGGAAQYYYSITAENFGLTVPEGYKIIGISRFGTGNSQVAVSSFSPTTTTGESTAASGNMMECKWIRNVETSSVKMPSISPTMEVLFAREEFVE